MKALRGYYDTYAKTWTNPVLTEFKIKGVTLDFTPSNDGVLLLTGNLDKIEILNSSNDVIVTDYKTGKPKSRNEIMGKTRAADASYYRQLVFYNLLLNKYRDGMYRMKAGEIDFVEPNDSGKYKKERFEITNDEVVLLENQIRQVADNILNLKFWDTKCDLPRLGKAGNKDCEWCGLREGMK